jgi:hypothetical protein
LVLSGREARKVPGGQERLDWLVRTGMQTKVPTLEGILWGT